MSTKRFVAPNMREAMRLVRTTLGPDAVILNTNTLKNGVEVIASVTDSNKPKENVFLEPDKLDSLVEKPLSAHNMTAKILLGATQVRAQSQVNNKFQTQTKIPARHQVENLIDNNVLIPDPVQLPSSNRSEWISEGEVLSEVRNELQSIRDFLSAQLSGLAWQEFKRMKPMQLSLLRRMLSINIESNTAMKLLQQVEEGADLQLAWSEALSILTNNLPIEHFDLSVQKDPIAIIGTSGVGKTLTLVKMAASLKLKNPNAKMVFLSTVTDGVASNALLRGFSRLMQIPVVLIASPKEYVQAINLHGKNQTIFIDTPSLDHGVHELSFPWLKLERKPKTIIAIPATSQYIVLSNAIEKASFLYPSGCILTKTDESSSIGEALSVLINSKLPLFFYTDGIRVPTNLHLPVLTVLMEKLLKGQLSTQQAEMAWIRQPLQVNV